MRDKCSVHFLVCFVQLRLASVKMYNILPGTPLYMLLHHQVFLFIVAQLEDVLIEQFKSTFFVKADRAFVFFPGS